MIYNVKFLEDGKVDIVRSKEEKTDFDKTFETIPNAPADFIRHDGGENLIISEDYAVAVEEQRKLDLEKEAQAYQDSKMSKNEASSILGRRVSEMKEKALENYQWLQSLWNLYYQKKEDATNETSFDSIGDKPYTFVQLQEEELSE